MLTLFQFPSAFGVPSASPFCLELESFLKLAEIPYRTERINDLATAPPAFATPLRAAAERRPNLVAYRDRITRELFADFAG